MGTILKNTNLFRPDTKQEILREVICNGKIIETVCGQNADFFVLFCISFKHILLTESLI